MRNIWLASTNITVTESSRTGGVHLSVWYSSICPDRGPWFREL